MDITIRSIENNELPNCIKVIQKSFATVANEYDLTENNCPGHTSFMKLEQLQNHYDWGWRMFGLFENEQLIGYFSLSKTTDHDYELHNLAILPESRHSGYGRKLLKYAKEKVRELGGDKLTIGIIDESKLLKNWYEINGFISMGTKKIDHLPFTVGFMECSL